MVLDIHFRYCGDELPFQFFNSLAKWKISIHKIFITAII